MTKAMRIWTLGLVAGGAMFLAFSPSLALSQTVEAPRMDSATLRARLVPSMAPPGQAMPNDVADLDSMVRKKDFGALTNRLRAVHTVQEIGLDLNWEQNQIYNGAGFIIGYAYMADLWRLGGALPQPQGDPLKQSAGMMSLYSYDLILLDGFQCADVSAPGHRLDQLSAQNRALSEYMRALPRATRMQLGTISLDIELATSSLRQNDDVLCSDGAAEMAARLKANGDKPLPTIPNPPGMYGRAYAVPPTPNYKPQFIGADLWRAKQAQARQSMAAMLTRLLTVPSDAQPAPSSK